MHFENEIITYLGSGVLRKAVNFLKWRGRVSNGRKTLYLSKEVPGRVLNIYGAETEEKDERLVSCFFFVTEKRVKRENEN